MILDNFTSHLGIKIVEVREGYAKGHMEIKDYHFNLHNTCHGGAIFSFADSIFAAASNSYSDIRAVALEANIQFFKPVKNGILIGEAKENFITDKIGSYTINIFQDNTLIALFNGIVYRKKI
ncbi:MAG TPA: hotdog fold thioesterase [Spirochaetota bacterium]|nr:hotdog fold thioesterase [Spirochaetota bacterium]HOM38069.1 hotdog fold thioesterase [Spirochaetota bacterium]HPQ48872.1 hotdog fold thioesterase [Spirochaetota bacterium]